MISKIQMCHVFLYAHRLGWERLCPGSMSLNVIKNHHKCLKRQHRCMSTNREVNRTNATVRKVIRGTAVCKKKETGKPKNAIHILFSEALRSSGDTNGLLRNSKTRAQCNGVREFSSYIPERNMSSFPGMYRTA